MKEIITGGLLVLCGGVGGFALSEMFHAPATAAVVVARDGAVLHNVDLLNGRLLLCGKGGRVDGVNIDARGYADAAVAFSDGSDAACHGRTAEGAVVTSTFVTNKGPRIPRE